MRIAPLLVSVLAMASPAMAGILSDTYTSHSTYFIDVSEASAVTYNWDTGTLYAIGDEGMELVELTKTGQRLGSMTFEQNVSPRELRALDDPEGLSYLGGGKVMIADERLYLGRVTTYTAGARLTKADLAPTSYAFSGTIGTGGNSGLEGVSYDPTNNSYWGIQEINNFNIYNMSGLGGPSSDAFDIRTMTRMKITQASDIYVMANSAYFDITDPRRMNILILSRDMRMIFEINRSGTVVDSMDISSLGRGTIEGMTMDDQGNLYLVAEQVLGGSGTDTSSAMYVFNVASVPEPSTYALIGIASLGAILRYVRKRA
jgi:uncharacterized protein YjiK